jgi:hypothetical protein
VLRFREGGHVALLLGASVGLDEAESIFFTELPREDEVSLGGLDLERLNILPKT